MEKEMRKLIEQVKNVEKSLNENEEKRYVAVVSYYVWANSDEEAINKVKLQCKAQDLKNDDHCELIELVEQPFATLGNRPVYKIDTKS
jgi:hypothetical protein